MKHLLFALLFITASASGQTANYTQSIGKNGVNTDNRSIFYDIGLDTLSGANDTLIVSFDRSFPAHYGYNLMATWLSTSTCTDGDVRLQGRNHANEDWQNIGSISFGSAGMSENDNDFAIGTKGYMYLRLRLINVDNIAHIRTSLVLKRI